MNGDALLRTEREDDLRKLAVAVESYLGNFKLIFAYCPYVTVQQQLARRLSEIAPVETLEIDEESRTLYGAIAQKIQSEVPQALQVLGLEKVTALERLILSAEPTREQFRKTFPFPLILWVNSTVQSRFLRSAPNFYSWGITRDFEATQAEGEQFLRENIESILTDDRTADASWKQDLAAVREDWQQWQEETSGETEGNLEALLGWERESEKDSRGAIAHYQKAIALLPSHNSPQLLSELLTRKAFCAYNLALLAEEKDDSKWQETRTFLQETLEFLERETPPETAARHLPKIGLILSQLQEWAQLQTLAETALKLPSAAVDSDRIADAWGFLAEVAIAKGDYREALHCSQEALQRTRETGGEKAQNQRHRFYYFQAKAQQGLGEVEGAIASLQKAKNCGVNSANFSLHIIVLTTLQSLYFQQKKAYLDAFKLGQEIVRVKQAFGEFAFVGASRLQGEINAELKNLVKIENDNLVAPEIIAAGRDKDTCALVERLLSDDSKIIVLYGESGVGKSSLVNAGLLPSLRGRVVAEIRFMPVVMRMYSDWAGVICHMV